MADAELTCDTWVIMTTVPHTRRAQARTTAIESLRALTISHHTASLEELERLALSPAARDALARRLEGVGIDAVLLATCNRTELYWISGGREVDEMVHAVLRGAGEPGELPGEHFTALEALAAVTHLFRVACGLESLVLGEAEILGQVRSALESAERAGLTGFLPALFRSALRTGRQARSETRIGQGALSIASAAVRALAQGTDLKGATVVVVGAGMTGTKAARHLSAERVGRLVLLNRTIQRARETATELKAEAAPLETLPRWLELADAVLLAVDVATPLLTPETLRRALGARSGQPLAVIDLSLPRAADPRCGSLPGITLSDLSALEHTVTHDRALREREIARVEALLARERAIFEMQTREAAVRPMVSELRRRAEAIRRREVARALATGPLDAAGIERLTRRLVDQLLHAPSEALRRDDDLTRDPEQAHTLRRVFGLLGAGDEGRRRDGPA